MNQTDLILRVGGREVRLPSPPGWQQLNDADRQQVLKLLNERLAAYLYRHPPTEERTPDDRSAPPVAR